MILRYCERSNTPEHQLEHRCASGSEPDDATSGTWRCSGQARTLLMATTMLPKPGTSVTSNKREESNHARALGRRPGETRPSPLRPCAAGSRWCREAHAANALDSVDLWPSALGLRRKLRTLALELRRGRLRRRGGIPVFAIIVKRAMAITSAWSMVIPDSGCLAGRLPDVCMVQPALAVFNVVDAAGTALGAPTMRRFVPEQPGVSEGSVAPARVVRCPERDWRAGRVPLDVRRRVRPGRRSAEARGRSLSVGRAGARCA